MTCCSQEPLVSVTLWLMMASLAVLHACSHLRPSPSWVDVMGKPLPRDLDGGSKLPGWPDTHNKAQLLKSRLAYKSPALYK